MAGFVGGFGSHATKSQMPMPNGGAGGVTGFGGVAIGSATGVTGGVGAAAVIGAGTKTVRVAPMLRVGAGATSGAAGDAVAAGDIRTGAGAAGTDVATGLVAGWVSVISPKATPPTVPRAATASTIASPLTIQPPFHVGADAAAGGTAARVS